SPARQPRVPILPRRNEAPRAPPPPLRGQSPLQGPPRAARHALLRDVARRAIAGNDRVRRPSLVCRRAVPSRAEIAAVRAASAVCVFRRRGSGSEPAGVVLAFERIGRRLVPCAAPARSISTAHGL